MIPALLALGAIGAALRWWGGRRLGSRRGTAVVNLAAAFLLGCTVGWSGAIATATRVGLLGALSTWSTLAGEVVELADDRPVAAAAYTLGSVTAGIAAAWAGLRLSPFA